MVPSVSSIRRAMSLLDRPSATSSTICCSRGLSNLRRVAIEDRQLRHAQADARIDMVGLERQHPLKSRYRFVQPALLAERGAVIEVSVNIVRAQRQRLLVAGDCFLGAARRPGCYARRDLPAAAPGRAAGRRSRRQAGLVSGTPNIAITKTASWADTNTDGLHDAGDVITYSIKVTNTGDVTLTGLSVTDALSGVLASGVTLAAGGSADYSRTAPFGRTWPSPRSPLFYGPATGRLSEAIGKSVPSVRWIRASISGTYHRKIRP